MLWLNQFLTGARPTRPDGRPLYAYSCTLTEYNTLTAQLQAVLPGRDPSTWSRHQCAVFCLFVSEWYQKGFAGGPWRRWENFLMLINLTLTPAERARVVQVGLDWWGRKVWVHNNHLEYLATLVSEGGMPQAWIRQAHANLLDYLNAILTHFHDFGMTGQEPPGDHLRIAEERSDALRSRLLRNPIVYRFAAEAAAGAWRLRRALDVDELPADFDLAWLKARIATWEDEFPFRLTDQAVVELLKALFLETDQVIQKRNAHIRYEAEIHRRDGGWSLSRALRFPARVTEEAVRTLFPELGDGEVPRRQILRTRRGGQLWAAGTLLRRTNAENPYWVLQGGGAVIEQEYGGLLLEGLDGTGTILESSTVSGAAALGELPWVFRPIGERWVFVSAGGCRRKEATLMVAFPEGWRCITRGYTDRGHLDERRVYEINQPSLFKGPDGDQVQVLPGQAQDEAVEYHLVGAQVTPWGGSEPIWKGMPRLLRRFVANGNLTEIHTPLQVKTARGWQRITNNEFGALVVRLVELGEVRWKQSITVLPGDFAYTITPDPQKMGGQIQVSGTDIDRIGIPVSKRYTVATRDRFTLDITATASEPPHALPLNIALSGGERVQLRVPFPSPWKRFEGRDGASMKSGARIHVSQLTGCRAVAFSPRRTRFVVVLKLQDGGPYYREPTLTLREQKEEGLYALPLELLQLQVDRLLSLTDTQDAWVQASISELGGRRGQRITLAIHRYDASLRPHRDTTGQIEDVQLDAPAHTGLTAADLDVEVWDLLNPASGSAPLPRLRSARLPNTWTFGGRHRSPGPWLVTGRQSGWYRVRPLLCTVRGAPEAPRTPLQAAICAPNDTRAQELRAAFARLEADPMDPDWLIFLGYFSFLDDFPPSAFDLFRELIHFPTLLTAGFFNSAERIEASLNAIEEMPFLWCLLTLDDWVAGLTLHSERIRRSLSAIPGGEEMLPTLLKDRLTTFTDAQPILHHAIRRWLARSEVSLDWTYPEGFELPAAVVAPHLIPRIQEEHTRLLQRRSGMDWPQPLGELPSVLCADPAARDLWTFRPGVDHNEQRQVIEAPVAAAVAAVRGQRVFSPTIFQELISFDPDYFDAVYQLAMAILEGRQRNGQ